MQNHATKLTEFKFVVRETKIEEPIGNALKQKSVINIGLQDISNGIIVPHPISHFIVNQYENYGIKVNSQRSAALTIARFLNYLYEQIDNDKGVFTDLRQKGLKGLTLYHGSCYISNMTSQGKSYGYVNEIEGFLTNFYDYLEKLDLIEEEFEIVEYVSGKRLVKKSPFDEPKFDTKYPPSNRIKEPRLKDFGSNRYLLVREYINIARNISPDISFGIALQIYGGLRRGEVVNLTRLSVPDDRSFGLTKPQVKITDNQNLLFPYIKNTSKEQVKRTRTQNLLPSDFLNEVYIEHMSRLRNIKSHIPNALFVNKDGYPITGTAYEEKFLNVKKEFIEKLRKAIGRYADYILVSESVWGTHIGRGIFTNFLLDIGLSPDEIRIARGDRSIESAWSYYCERNGIKNINAAVKEISNADESNFGFIDYSKIESDWNKEVFYRGTNG